ncbi:unnamed protein product, partial [Laminaria digitata]
AYLQTRLAAICADGSAGHFYLAANTTSSDFVVFLGGGGGCAHDQTLCEKVREYSPQLFTSEGFPDTMAAFGFLSGDSRENPMYSTYNRVYLPYCSMDMYLLDTGTPDGLL